MRIFQATENAQTRKSYTEALEWDDLSLYVIWFQYWNGYIFDVYVVDFFRAYLVSVPHDARYLVLCLHFSSFNWKYRSDKPINFTNHKIVLS